jgi:hypothetical protein
MQYRRNDMALSLIVLQNVKAVGLDKLYEGNKVKWNGKAKESHKFIKANFPTDDENYDIHPEDVAKSLVTLIEVDKELKIHLITKRLKQKYWVKYFCDYILDRCWNDIHK